MEHTNCLCDMLQHGNIPDILKESPETFQASAHASRRFRRISQRPRSLIQLLIHFKRGLQLSKPTTECFEAERNKRIRIVISYILLLEKSHYA